MCDIFPTLTSCCKCFSLRIGLLLIAVLCIMTGALGLTSVTQRNRVKFADIHIAVGRATNVTDFQSGVKYVTSLFPTAISCVMIMFIVGGMLLLFANLTNNPPLAQAFVWGVFLAIVVCFVLIIGVVYECIVDNTACVLGGMDWLSGATVLVLFTCYLLLWIYFVAVGNSYAISED